MDFMLDIYSYSDAERFLDLTYLFGFGGSGNEK